MHVVSIDVECAASGRGHNDRVPCRVSCVDASGRVLLDEIMNVGSKCFSPMEPFTGLTADAIDKGVDFDRARSALIQNCLTQETVVVGQNIKSDITWMQLEEGVHFGRAVDLVDHFKVWNTRFNDYMKFPLWKTAFALLGENPQAAGHDSVTDARVSMQLYLQYCAPDAPKCANEAGNRLLSMTIQRKFPPFVQPTVDGVCTFKFNSEKCFCGQPVEGNDTAKGKGKGKGGKGKGGKNGRGQRY